MGACELQDGFQGWISRMDEKEQAAPACPWKKLCHIFKGGAPGWMRRERLHLPAHGKHFAIFYSVELLDEFEGLSSRMDEKEQAAPACPWKKLCYIFKGGAPGWVRRARLSLPARYGGS